MRHVLQTVALLFCVFFAGNIALASGFHVLVDNKQQGPVPMDQLQQMATDGTVTKDTMVWKDGMADWAKAGEQQELQNFFVVSPPLPPPVPRSGTPPPVKSQPPNKDVINVSKKITGEEKQDTSIHNFPLAEDIAGSNLEQQRDKWLKGKTPRRKIGFDKKGSYIGWGIATIEVDPQSLDFGQKRIMAFEKAFTDAKGSFVRTKKQKVAVEISKKFFQTDLTEKELELKDGKFVGIGKKVAAVAEGKLDKMLVDLGIDPKDVENSDIASKRLLAKNSLSKDITVTSTQSIAGIRILATFEDAKGVGVLIKQNRNYRSLAQAIASGNLVGYPTKTDPAEEIALQLEQKFTDKKDLIPQYGVRIMADAVGNRVLVSFGQWSPKVTKSDSRMRVNMAVKAAKGTAYAEALSYMTQFVNTTLSLENTTKLKDSDTITAITKTDNTTDPEIEDSSVGASIDQFIKENSNWTCEGCTEIIDWSVNHPETGHLIVGKVLMWSPLTQEYAQQKPQQTNNGLAPSPKVREIESKIRTSVDIGDEDF